MKFTISPYWIIGITIAIALIAILVGGFIPIKMHKDFDFEAFSKILQQVVLIALFVERGVKILFPTNEPPGLSGLTKKIGMIKRFSQAGAVVPFNGLKSGDLVSMIETQSELRKEKYQKNMFIQMIAGLIISIVGFRILNEMIDPSVICQTSLMSIQCTSFQLLDIIITGLLIGGGASGLEKIIDYIKERI